MRATAFGCLLMVFCSVPPIAHAEPVKLTDSELDAITAGAVYVSADAEALAIGDGAFTAVNTDTQTGGAGIFEWGLGRANAHACCGPQTDAEVSLNGSGDGPFVAKIGMVNKVVGLGLPSAERQYSTATGFIIVMSLDPAALGLLPHPQNTDVQPRAKSPLVARLVRPMLSRPVVDSSDLGTNEDTGTVAYGLAASSASGLSAAVADVFSFAATLPDFSAAAATSLSLRD